MCIRHSNTYSWFRLWNVKYHEKKIKIVPTPHPSVNAVLPAIREKHVSYIRIWNRVMNFGTGSGYPVTATNYYRNFSGLPDTSATRHFGIKTLLVTSALISRHLDTENVVRDTSTRVPWSRKSRDTLTQDNSDETQLHGWFVLNFGTNFVVPKCLVAEVYGSLSQPMLKRQNI